MLSQAFGQDVRLKTAEEYRLVFQNRKSSHGRYFSVHGMTNTLDRPKLGLAVSKKVSKKAVERNRIKRQIRESFRMKQQELAAINYVVVAKPAAAGISGNDLLVDLKQLWVKTRNKCERS